MTKVLLVLYHFAGGGVITTQAYPVETMSSCMTAGYSSLLLNQADDFVCLRVIGDTT